MRRKLLVFAVALVAVVGLPAPSGAAAGAYVFASQGAEVDGTLVGGGTAKLIFLELTGLDVSGGLPCAGSAGSTGRLYARVEVTRAGQTDVGCGATVDSAGDVDAMLIRGDLDLEVPSVTHPGRKIFVTVEVTGTGVHQFDRPVLVSGGNSTNVDGHTLLSRSAVATGSVVSQSIGGGQLSPTSTGRLFTGFLGQLTAP